MPRTSRRAAGAKTETECPLCCLIKAFEDKKGQHAAFFDHLKTAEKEVWLALKTLIDERLASFEEKPAKKATKIKVE